MTVQNRRQFIAGSIAASAALTASGSVRAQNDKTGAAWNWVEMPGRANDILHGWMISTEPASGGYRIYRWDFDAQTWEKMPGAGVRIGGTPNAPYLANDRNRIYRWNGSSWDQLPGRALDVAMGFIVGTAQTAGGYRLYRWINDDWEQLPGGGVRIGGTGAAMLMRDDKRRIFRWNNDDWEQMPGRARDVAASWVVGTNAKPGGYDTYRWDGAGDWDAACRGAVAISAGTVENAQFVPQVWVATSAKKIYRRTWHGELSCAGGIGGLQSN